MAPAKRKKVRAADVDLGEFADGGAADLVIAQNIADQTNRALEAMDAERRGAKKVSKTKATGKTRS